MLNEHWSSLFPELIPTDDYKMQLIQGEEKGLIIQLFGQQHHITLDFGIVHAINILDEGVQLCDPPGVCFQNQKELHRAGFPDTVYQVENGAYAAYIQAGMTRELYEAMNLRQINLVTMNYVVEIICFEEPTFTVT